MVQGRLQSGNKKLHNSEGNPLEIAYKYKFVTLILTSLCSELVRNERNKQEKNLPRFDAANYCWKFLIFKE